MAQSVKQRWLDVLSLSICISSVAVVFANYSKEFVQHVIRPFQQLKVLTSCAQQIPSYAHFCVMPPRCLKDVVVYIARKLSLCSALVKNRTYHLSLSVV